MELRAQVVRSDPWVTCTGLRHWLRAAPAPDGGLVVETTDRVAATWRRVDHDLVLLTRAAVRLRIASGETAARFAREVAPLAGVTVRDDDPVGATIRATYPLLATGTQGRLPAIPAVLPPHLQGAFRRSRPREAARLLFAGRATRPVVRTFCAALDRPGAPDLLALTVAVAAARVLEPDHVAALLHDTARASCRETAPLQADECAGLAALLEGVAPRRVRRLLTIGLADDAGRQRMRFVAAERTPAGPGLADVADWEELAVRVAATAEVTDGWLA
jgi:hypothetical protein